MIDGSSASEISQESVPPAWRRKPRYADIVRPRARQPLSVVFVCFGNICRSPMAEAFFRHELSTRPALADVRVESAGVGALDGHAASAEAIQVMRGDYGLDITAHRAQRFDMLNEPDLVLTMDGYITQRVKEFAFATRVEMLGDFAGQGETVRDPFGESLDAYRDCAQLIRRLVEAAADRIENELGSPAGGTGSSKPPAS